MDPLLFLLGCVKHKVAAPALFLLAELLSSDQKLPGSVCWCHHGGAVEMCKLYISRQEKGGGMLE